VPHPQDTEYYININSVREVRPFLSSFRPSCRLAIVRGVVSPEAVFGRARCALARIHLGERLLQKWERTAGSVYTGAPSGFV
jgi:hypothetical protein